MLRLIRHIPRTYSLIEASTADGALQVIPGLSGKTFEEANAFE
jgi:hypothetical protein